MGERFDGKVAVITGGASGIGRATARRFVAEGASVVLGDLNEQLLADARDELGDRCRTERVDVRVESDVARLVAAAVDLGGPDIAVNSAGLGTFAPITAHDEEQWDLVVDVCLKGVFLAVKHEAAAMADRGAGVIVNIASINARVPAEGMAAYCSAKAGVEMFTRCAAMELGPAGVRVCGIAPGFVETPLTAFAQALPQVREAYVASIPLGRAGTPEDIAAMAAFLATDDASWVTGETIAVDGAESTKGYPDLARLAVAPPPA